MFTALSLLLPLCGGIAVWMCWAGLWSETSSRSSACQNTSILATGCHCRPGSQWDASSEDHPLYLKVIGQIEKQISESVRAFVAIFSLWSHIIDLGKGWGESTRKCGVLPGDTQSASMGQMSNIGHMTCQFCGFSCHLGAQDGFEVQCKARFWEEKGRKFKVKLTLLMRWNDKTSTNRTKPFIHTYTLRLCR